MLVTGIVYDLGVYTIGQVTQSAGIELGNRRSIL